MVIVIQDIPETTTCNHLERGMVVRHKRHGLVFIYGGGYMGTYGVSNHFYWKKINEDGTLEDKKRYGYGYATDFPCIKSLW
jgi:hypothetical protein